MPGYTTAGSGPAPNISDDQGMAVDRIIAGMDGKTQYVLLQLYLYRQTMTAVGQSVVISNRRVAEYRDQGLNDLYGALKQLSRNAF
jgi:DNA-directed RNA polymerase specialized sigma subunit